MKLFIALLLFIAFALSKNVTTDPTLFCVNPIVKALTFNTYGINTGKYLMERIGTLASVLPKFLNDNHIDVTCLQELWDPEIRGYALSGIKAPSQVYHPAPLAQPGCANSCFNFKIDDHPIINQQIQLCALAPVLPDGMSCATKYEDNLAFQQCFLQVAAQLSPGLVDYITLVNPQCIFCVTTPIAGENMEKRVHKCSDTYVKADADKCRFAFGGQADSTIVTRLPILEKGYFPYPDNINPLSNRGITYVKLRSKLGLHVKVFCTHMITSPDGIPPDYFVKENAAQVKASIDYVKSKTKPGDVIIYLGDTNNGLGGKTWNAIWPDNYKLFTNVWKDASAPKGLCTYGCNILDPTPGAPRDIDHIFVPKNSFPHLTFTGTKIVLDQRIVNTTDGMMPLSDHSGMMTTICQGI